MIKVQVRSNEPLDAALRRFKRQCNYAGVFRLAKKYSFFEKRSDKNRREERERVRNIQRAIRKAEERQRPRGRKKSKVKGNQAAQADGENTENQNAQAQQQGGENTAAAKPADANTPASATDVAGALQTRGDAPRTEPTPSEASTGSESN